MPTKKNALIINHQNFSNIGGIEKWLYYLVQNCIKNSIRVIWLCDEKPIIHPVFKNLMINDKVERVNVKRQKWRWFVYQKLKLRKDERYVVFCANPINMCVAQDIMLRYKGFDIFPVYSVPDTTGNMYFLERNFRIKCVNIAVWRVMRNMIYRWDRLNAIRFFSNNHVKALEENYDISVLSPDEKRLKSNVIVTELDENCINKKAENRTPFVLSTVGRFDFPHKGYMLGLVRSFGRLKQEYPELELHIAGYGAQERLLLNEIAKLSEKAKESVKIVGPIHPDDLNDFFKSSHLNISVAGAATSGAKVGTLTLVARSYCEGECEVYGFFHDCHEKNTSLAKGFAVDPFIRQVLAMKREEYIEMCKKGYEIVSKRSKMSYDPNYIFNSTKEEVFLPSYKEVFQMKILKRLIGINHYLKML